MKKTVVLGIGNRLMGDDGIGNCIVEELKRRNAFPGLSLIAGETDTDYCLDELDDAGSVILIDASNRGAEPCSVAVTSLEDAFKERSSAPCSHSFNLIHALQNQPFKAAGILITVEAGSIAYHFGLSPGMKAQFSGIVDDVYQHISAYIKKQI